MIAAACPGVVSSRTASAAGSSASDPTRRPVSMRPPAASTIAAKASTIDWLPPVATGMPAPWPAAASASATPPLVSELSGVPL